MQKRESYSDRKCMLVATKDWQYMGVVTASSY